jgi:hypothetical protein
MIENITYCSKPSSPISICRYLRNWQGLIRANNLLTLRPVPQDDPERSEGSRVRKLCAH